MKKLLSVLLAAAVLICGLAVVAEQDGAKEDRFSVLRIRVPTVPPVEVPEIPEIEVPEVPTPAPTKKPKIEVPEIPEVDVDAPDVPRVTADAPAQLESALAAMGVTDYPALRDALGSGEAMGDGSRGDAARGLQQLLVAFGQNIKADGIVGPKTLAALNAVQAQYELPQTDRLDAEGLATLLPLLLMNGQDEPK